MTLNGVTALISPYSISLQAYYVTMVEHRPIMSAEYRLPLFAHTDPHWRGLSTIAELLVGCGCESKIWIFRVFF